jgi:hypothetical protein
MSGMNEWAEWTARNGTRRYRMSTKKGWDSFVHSPPREDFGVLTVPEMGALTSAELLDYNEARQIWNRNTPQ